MKQTKLGLMFIAALMTGTAYAQDLTGIWQQIDDKTGSCPCGSRLYIVIQCAHVHVNQHVTLIFNFYLFNKFVAFTVAAI